jgi:AcrR family transcriptional regulator
MENIAQRAGIAVGTLYNYFADRDALVHELIKARKVELVATTERGIEAGHGRPFNEQLVSFLRELFTYLDAHRAFFSVLFQGELTRSNTSREHAKQTIQEMYSPVEKLLKRAVREKVLRQSDSELFPALLFGMVRGAIVATYLKAKSGQLVDLAEPVARCFLQGAQERSR